MKILIDEDTTQTRIAEMASEIDFYYYGKDWYRHIQEPIIVVGVLTGAIFFVADLVRQLSIRTELDFIRTSTYPITEPINDIGREDISEEITVGLNSDIIAEPVSTINNSHVLIIDDILDSGSTYQAIRAYLFERGAKDIRLVTLLKKPGKAPDNIKADFVGFDIEDKWVAGYGMDDRRGLGREIPYIFVDEGTGD
jgi:hypoxanthine phosphoribosyltransferase